MGLFFHSSAGLLATPTKNKKAPRLRITEAERRLLNCSHCPLDKAQLHRPKMPPAGAVNPAFYFMWDMPGKKDEELGEHFSGAAGRMVRDRIPVKWDKHIRWNNVLRCRAPNKHAGDLEIACCRRLQVEDIEHSKPQIIVGFGNHPLHWMLGDGRAVVNWRGRRVPVKIGGHVCWFYPITDPDALIHSRDKKMAAAYLRCFERDLQRVFDDYAAGLPEPYVEDGMDYHQGIELIDYYGEKGISKIEAVLAELRDIDHAVDIETNGIRPYGKNPRILTIAAGTYGGTTYAFPWKHPEAKWTLKEHARIRKAVEDYLYGKGKKWCHNSRFEQEWIAKEYGAGPLLNSAWGDTLGQAHILDSRPCKELDELTQLYFGFRIKALSNIDVANLENTPLSEVLPYNALDAKYTDALRHVQAELLESVDGLTGLYEFVNGLTPSFALMQQKGVVRNLSAVNTLDGNLDEQEKIINENILKNSDIIKYRNTGHPFNPNSNPNLVSFFRDFLKIVHPERQRSGGAWHRSSSDKNVDEDSYSVAEPVLALFKHPVAKLILELRTIKKCRGYVTPLHEGGKYVHADGLVHASYSQYSTVSGRSSCSDPNQQNYPRREHKEIRRVVGCPPGHKFVAFDYGQLEWRIGACISRDKRMCEELRLDGHDIHGIWTDDIGGRFVPERVKANRKKVRDSIKMFWTFANLYGNELGGLAWDLSNEFGVDISAAALEPFYLKFWTRYPMLKKYQEDIVARYWRDGFVETATGLRRYEPMKRNEIINHPFQGTAGHLVIEAQHRLARASYELDRPSLLPIMNIHDDLSFYIPEQTLERDIEDIARYMCCSGLDFVTVPLTVEASVGNNWCDKEEIATFSTKDFT